MQTHEDTELTPVHLTMFPAAILVGIIGGVLGAIFTVINLFIVKKRAQFFDWVRHPAAKKFLRMLEVVIIMVSLMANERSTVLAAVTLFITSRALLCAVYAMALCLCLSVCLSVCVCVCHKSVFY